MRKSFVLLFFMGIIILGIIILQMFLSRKENKWLGLILPTINTICSIMAVLGLALYEKETITQIVIKCSIVFLMYNIPTMILLLIHFLCREKFKKNKEIEKMNIQDL